MNDSGGEGFGCVWLAIGIMASAIEMARHLPRAIPIVAICFSLFVGSMYLLAKARDRDRKDS